MSTWGAVAVLDTGWYLFYYCDKCDFRINSKDTHTGFREGGKCPKCGDVT